MNLSQIGKCAFSTFETLRHSYDSAKYCIENKIDGVFVECGVAGGSQIGAFGLACKEAADKRHIYGYDSFEGIPFAGKYDIEQPGFSEKIIGKQSKKITSSGVSSVSLEDVESNLKKWGLDLNQFILVKGWFQKTVPKNNIDTIAILRLDGDLYESTRVCLEYFYKKVTPGGIIIIDDYALLGCELACTDFFNKEGINPKLEFVIGSWKVAYFYK